MDINVAGLINTIALGLATGITTGVSVVLYSKKKAYSQSLKIDKKFDDLSLWIQKIDREIYPATKNGTLVTSDQLDKKIDLLTAESNRRHTHTKELISLEIKSLRDELQRMNASNSNDHRITKKDLEEVVRRIIDTRLEGL